MLKGLHGTLGGELQIQRGHSSWERGDYVGSRHERATPLLSMIRGDRLNVLLLEFAIFVFFHSVELSHVGIRGTMI